VKAVAASARRVVHVAVDESGYDAHIGAGVLAELGTRIMALAPLGPVVIVTNPTVRALYGAAVESSLAGCGIGARIVEIPDGEQYKTLETLELIFDAALSSGADRSSVIVALGGGVVGDLAGFAAASLFRGVRLYMVPTTLLAQVDSSVGGKTGVNRPHGKNLVGAFHQPRGVLADTSTLATLSDREYRAGLAEVVKYGVILDKDLFDLLERESERVLARDEALLVEIVERCIAIKARVVERDEREAGLRRLLNFGHTVGHAIEKVTGYTRFLHGEAVAMGMVAAAKLSEQLGACESGVASRIERLLQALELPATISGDLGRQSLVDAVAFDKKVSGDKVIFVVVERIGHCVQREIDRGLIATAL
jgi:3-dehydroquinate synthase